MKKLTQILAAVLAIAPAVRAGSNPAAPAGSQRKELSKIASTASSGSNRSEPEQKWEIGVGVSGVSIINVLFPYLAGTFSHPNPVDDGRENTPDIEIPANLNINARYNVKNWLSVGGTLSTQYLAKKRYKTVEDNGTGEEARTYNGLHSMGVVSIMPAVRFNYLNRPRITLYGELMAGVSLYMYDRICHPGGDNEPLMLMPSFQVTPIGITCGSKVFFFAELGAGMQWCGGQAGVGFRF